MPCELGSLKQGEHFKYLPYAFTEQGVSMPSAVLGSPKAVDISIRIMRAFVRLRMILATNDALRYAIEGLERRANKSKRDIRLAIKAIQSIVFYLRFFNAEITIRGIRVSFSLVVRDSNQA
jgi:hypothetical protein